MKKFFLVGAVALSALFGIGAEAAPVAGLAAVQTGVSDSGDLQKVFYRRGHWYRHGYYGHYGWWRYHHRYYGGYRRYGRW
jgi:hypothetical protein